MRIRRAVQAVIFCNFNGEERFLLVKKQDFSARRYRWRLLKGGVKTGESEIEALKREIFEEVGLEDVQVLGKVYSYQFTFKNVRHMVSSYKVKANQGEHIRLQISEVAGYTWVPKEKAIRMLHWKNEIKALAA
ncbi:MAG: NUDIX hydrolase [Candidatus Bathyarchaeota archaeon]|jgi:8-oxo-dGTP pyrophosphatase MutT (NUDIX family)|nr:NUDIX hydrolase [Candidatus Bathyarchaeota archaeon]